MNSHKRIDYLTRDGVLKLLSDDEAASVSNAESAEELDEGDEYLDLEHLDEGVRKADGLIVIMGRVLPRKAVHEITWSKILAVVGGGANLDGAR
jgi:hypothetical protein